MKKKEIQRKIVDVSNAFSVNISAIEHLQMNISKKKFVRLH